jgi:hypothetical protein
LVYSPDRVSSPLSPSVYTNKLKNKNRGCPALFEPFNGTNPRFEPLNGTNRLLFWSKFCTKYIFSLENYTQLCSGEKKTPVISVMTEGSEGAMPGARGWARRRLALGAAAVCAVVLLAVTSSLSYYHPVVVYSAGYGHLVATASASHLRRDLQEQISAEVRDVLQHAQGALKSSPCGLPLLFLSSLSLREETGQGLTLLSPPSRVNASAETYASQAHAAEASAGGAGHEEGGVAWTWGHGCARVRLGLLRAQTHAKGERERERKVTNAVFALSLAGALERQPSAAEVY